MAQII